jgi:hypothetical protein
MQGKAGCIADTEKSNYCNLHEGKKNNGERRSMEISKGNQEMEEDKNEETRCLEMSEEKKVQWEESEEGTQFGSV